VGSGWLRASLVGKSGKTIAYVGRIADLARFAIADDIEPDADLPLHDLEDGPSDHLFVAIIGCASIFPLLQYL
jgi:hypothetical protein